VRRFTCSCCGKNASLVALALLIALVPLAANADYIVSGSPDGSSTFLVDDDLDIYVNEKLVFTDGVALANPTHPLVDLGTSLTAGDTLKFVVRNTYGYCTGLSPLFITCSPGSYALAAAGMTEHCGYDQGTGDPPVSYTSSYSLGDLCSGLSLTINPLKVPNDGTSFTYATATLLDSNLSAVAGKTVTFAVPPSVGTLVSDAAQTTDSKGQATVEILAGTTVGAGQITATDENGDTSSATLTILQVDKSLPDGLSVEDTLRQPGETDRQVIERLYKKAIPIGYLFSGFGSGVYNNVAAAVTSLPIVSSLVSSSFQEGLWKDSCGGYQAQVLDLLDSLRQNPNTSGYFKDLDYGPVQSNLGGHHAVVLYDHGTSYRSTGDVLDPWISQSPTVYSWSGWQVLNYFSGMTDTSTQKGLYPLTGGTSYPGRGSRQLEPPHPYRASDPPLDNDTYNLQVVVRGPVTASMTDAQGRTVGELANGTKNSMVPLSGYYILPDANGNPFTYFFLLGQQAYTLNLVGNGSGNADVAVSWIDPVNATLETYDYQPIPFTAGAAMSAPLSYELLGQDLEAPSGQYIPPNNLPPPSVVLSGGAEIKITQLNPGPLVSEATTSGFFEVTNYSGEVALITSVTVQVTNPTEFASLALYSNAGQAIPSTPGVTATETFNFPNPMVINNNVTAGIGLVAQMVSGALSPNDAVNVTAVAATPITPDGGPVLALAIPAAQSPIAETVTVDQTTLNFGTRVKIGEKKTEFVTISNSAERRSARSMPIAIESVQAFPSVFTTSTTCHEALAPGKSCKVIVTFTPTSTTVQKGLLAITTNAAGPPQVRLKGTGFEPMKKK
jgi:peroxiredoxin